MMSRLPDASPMMPWSSLSSATLCSIPAPRISQAICSSRESCAWVMRSAASRMA